MRNTDIAIIGGGASGLAAAIAIKKYSDHNVTILERQSRIGKKILSTGNGRCNLTNSNISKSCYNGTLKLLDFITSDFIDTEDFFAEMGLACKNDGQGRIYPHSMAASSVLDALRFTVSSTGTDIICDYDVKEIKPSEKNFIITNGEEEIKADCVIIATGGCATPSLGSDGSGYKIAEKLGHTTTHLYPALAPVRTDINLVKALKGLRTYAKASLCVNKDVIAEQTGEVQFSDGALSGICIFNLSALSAQYIGKAEIILDIAPDYSKKEIADMLLVAQNSRTALPCEELMTGLFHKRIGQAILKSLSINFNKSCKDVSQKDIYAISDIIKKWRFPVTAVSDWSLAQVTCGGISSEEITDKFESTIRKGVFFSGEILDINGICGGYNLDFAWKSGYTAGKNATDYIYSIKE